MPKRDGSHWRRGSPGTYYSAAGEQYCLNVVRTSASGMKMRVGFSEFSSAGSRGLLRTSNAVRNAHPREHRARLTQLPFGLQSQGSVVLRQSEVPSPTLDSGDPHEQRQQECRRPGHPVPVHAGKPPVQGWHERQVPPSVWNPKTAGSSSAVAILAVTIPILI